MVRRFARRIRSIGSARFGVERTPKGPRLVVSRSIDAPPAVVWELLTDTRRWPEWGLSITAVEPSKRIIAPGTHGTVRLVGGLDLPFAVETCANGRWTWRVCGVRATGHRVEPAPNVLRDTDPSGSAGRRNRCRVVFEVPVLAAPYALVCARALSHLDRLATGNRDRGLGTDRGE